MRINYISLNNQPVQINKKSNCNLKQVENNAFVSSCDKISFCKNFETRYKALKNDLINYVIYADCIKEEDLGKIFKKHCPNSSFKEMKRVYVGEDDIVSYAGDTQKEYSIKNTLGFKRKAILEKQTIAAVLPQDDSNQEKILFISRLLHEGAHALQAISFDRKTELETINNFLKKEGSVLKIQENLEFSSKIYESLYAELLELSSKAMSAMLPIGEDNPKNLTAQSACLEYYGQTVEEIAHDIFEGVFEDYYEINKEFLLDYCISIAQCEVEAYSKEIEYLKTTGYDYRKTLSQIKIEINKAIIDVANLLK